MLSGRSGGSLRPGLRIPPSITTWPTWMPCGDSSRARLCARAAQRELAHRERRRLGVTLHACRSAGEQDRAVLVRQHALDRLLRHQEAAKGADRNRLLDFGGIEFDERAARAVARVVDDDVRRGERGFDLAEKLGDLAACLVASHANARPPTSLARPDSSPARRAASATCMPAFVNVRASEAERPAPTPTMSAVR